MLNLDRPQSTDQTALRRAARQQARAGLQPAAEDGQASRPERAHSGLRGGPQQKDEVSPELSPINRYGSTVAKFLMVRRSEKVV